MSYDECSILRGLIVIIIIDLEFSSVRINTWQSVWILTKHHSSVELYPAYLAV